MGGLILTGCLTDNVLSRQGHCFDAMIAAWVVQHVSLQIYGFYVDVKLLSFTLCPFFFFSKKYFVSSIYLSYVYKNLLNKTVC